jgi:hypothetical protein
MLAAVLVAAEHRYGDSGPAGDLLLTEAPHKPEAPKGAADLAGDALVAVRSDHARSPLVPRPEQAPPQAAVGVGSLLDDGFQRFQLPVGEDGHELGAVVAYQVDEAVVDHHAAAGSHQAPVRSQAVSEHPLPELLGLKSAESTSTVTVSRGPWLLPLLRRSAGGGRREAVNPYQLGRLAQGNV